MATKKATAEKEVKEVKKVEDIVEEINENAKITEYLNEKVPFYAFKDNDKYKDDITVGVNGRIFRIKRGTQVMIPRYVYNVIARGMEQDVHTSELIDAQSVAYSAEARKWGV